MKISYNLNDKFYFKWRRIVYSVPRTWKKVLKESQGDSSSLLLLDHQLLKNNRTQSIQKMISKGIYSIAVSSKVSIPTSRIHFENRFPLYNFQRKDNDTAAQKIIPV